MTEWSPLEEFPDYSVSDHGEVRHDDRDRLMMLQVNQQGIVNVGLTKDHEQYKRAVAPLVASAFLPVPANPNFDTPIHLDGDRTNLHAWNLMWRPRWFAVKYHKQFNEPSRGFFTPIVEVETGHKFPTSFEAAIKYGLLDKEIMYAIVNGGHTFPTYQHWREWEE